MSDADIQWCTKCKNLWRSHDGCGVAHKSFVKEVETLELTETDEEVILDAIQQEKSITWRQALKLVEELQDTRAESAVRGDDRDELERRQERWARSYEAASGDSLGSRTPEEALSTLVDLLLPGSVAEFFEARETRGEEDDRAFLTDEEQSQTDVVAILKFASTNPNGDPEGTGTLPPTATPGLDGDGRQARRPVRSHRARAGSRSLRRTASREHRALGSS